DDLACRGCAQPLAAAVGDHLDAARAQPRVAALEQYARDVRPGPDLQVVARQHRPQEGLGRVPADAAALVDLEVADAFVVAAVEVLAVRDAGLLCRFGERIEDVPAQALPLDAPLAAGPPALGVETRRGMKLVGAAVVVLVL